MKTDLDRGMLPFPLAVLMLIWLFFLSAIYFHGISACPGIQQFSILFFSNLCRFAMLCCSFRTFGLFGICFCSPCMKLIEFVNIEKFFLFVADIAFRARCIVCVSAVNIEINFGNDADSVRFPVVAAARTYISLLEPSVYMCFHPLCLFSKSSLNLFW